MLNPRSARFSSFFPFARSLFFILFPFLLLIAEAKAAPALLRCQVSQGGEIKTLEFAPVSDPYTVKSADINGVFRFKAAFIGSEQRIEYIKLYVYYHQTKNQWVLLQQAKYTPPFNQAVDPSVSLTGTNYLYSPQLGRELQYSCTLSGSTL